MKRLLPLFFLFYIGIVQSQQIEDVDFKRIQADLKVEDSLRVSGTLNVEFQILNAVDSIYLDAVQMDFDKLQLTQLDPPVDMPFDYQATENKIVIVANFEKNAHYSLRFHYIAQPKKALYFVGEQIWTQGQGKYTSNWLPSIDDMNDKIEFDLSITFSKDYEVLANGELIRKEHISEGQTQRHYDMQHPMSSYLVALAIGRYHKVSETSKGGVPLEYYYYPKDSSKVEPTYRYSKQIFDFLEREIGYSYPWNVYRQVPVKDFLYSGMENTSLTIFSDALVVDSIGFHDRNYVNVNAHELAHQWFGNLVTETSGTHHWLQEGFATYYALLAERDIFGENYYYWRLHDYAQQLLEQEIAGKSTSLLDPKSSSVTFYQKGCWALHILREQVGDTAFRSAVANYLRKHQFQNVETADFIVAVENESGMDMTEFEDTWLESVALPQDAMVKSLKKSPFIREYLEVSCQEYPERCQDYLVSDISDKAKIKILMQDTYEVKLEDFNNGWEVRQAIAQKLSTIPSQFKTAYESLLKDASYITMETALYHLWVNFPKDRAKYLYQTKDVYGFSDYNVRLMWLALHLNTIEYQSDKKQSIFEELKGYTDPKYGSELRMNAFGYLKLIDGFDLESLENLVEATKHHNWRFQKFAKDMLATLEEHDRFKSILQEIRK